MILDVGTTTAIVILNEYLVARTAQHIRKQRRIEGFWGCSSMSLGSRTLITASFGAGGHAAGRNSPGITSVGT
ncbi:hypothetical protein [Desulfosporosinus nitroreducens]|uniref:hypothetical protein n=1 Tax=Desulfosporosinus nitroreducens TaxID=2018668 RepID=UPI00207C46D7|nr:hypothetical protein [Desulfosporosinus nitroreducens]MCO1604380.1 hypothetical protein [Desulfosporosinus nitroreducens]